MPFHDFMEDLVTAVIAEVFNTLSLCSVKCYTTLKQSVIALSPFHCDSSIVGGRTVTSEYSVLPYGGKRRYFHVFLCL